METKPIHQSSPLSLSSLTGLIIAFAAGAFSGQGKYVEVKGLSEQIVKTDRGIWSMTIEIKSNDVNDLYNQVTKTTNNITKFLTAKGFEEKEINSASKCLSRHLQRSAISLNANLSMSVYTDKIDLLSMKSHNKPRL